MTTSYADTAEVPVVSRIVAPAALAGRARSGVVPRRVALRRARRQRHLLAGASVGILLAMVVLTVLIVGVVR